MRMETSTVVQTSQGKTKRGAQGDLIGRVCNGSFVVPAGPRWFSPSRCWFPGNWKLERRARDTLAAADSTAQIQTRLIDSLVHCLTDDLKTMFLHALCHMNPLE